MPLRRLVLIAFAAGIPWWGRPVAAFGQQPFPEAALAHSEIWDTPAFLDEFLPKDAPSDLAHRQWQGDTTLFGLKPHSIHGVFDRGKLLFLTVLFLDSGTHFGYVPRREARATEKANQEEFAALYQSVTAEVTAGLKKLTAAEGEELTLGGEPMLTMPATLFRGGDLTLRLLAVREQLVKVTAFRSRELARHWIGPAYREIRPRERSETFAREVSRQPNGDVLLENIPFMPQGDRAYCGVSALAMGMQYLGLNLDTEDYAAAAGIRYGSTKGSKIREVYDAAAGEAGFRLYRATRFDFAKAMKSIDEGLPVFVWRRWTQERDYVHMQFARRYREDPAAVLPSPDRADRETWPGKVCFTHASVITGYNEARGEVIFSEAWSELVRNRRMRHEEMEGTAYYTFYLRL